MYRGQIMLAQIDKKRLHIFLLKRYSNTNDFQWNFIMVRIRNMHALKHRHCAQIYAWLTFL